MTDVQDGRTFTLDTTDVDRYVGKALPTVELLDPVTVGDIRRWAQGMQYPNPPHYDVDAAAAGPFGAIIAPQSFSVACDIGHGAIRSSASPYIAAVSMWLTPCSSRSGSKQSAVSWSARATPAAPKMTRELTCPVRP